MAGSTTDEEGAPTGDEQRRKAVRSVGDGERSHDESELVGQLVLAKLSNLEHHQRKGDRGEHHRTGHRKAKASKRGGTRSRRVHVPLPPPPHGLHQPKPVRAGGEVEEEVGRDALSPPSTALISPPLSPAPAPYASVAVRHVSLAYQVRELSKPYRQGELLVTLARWMEGGLGADEGGDEGRWEGRAISGEESMSSNHSGVDSGDVGSDGEGREEEQAQSIPLPAPVPVEREVQRSYNAVHAEREAAFPSPGRPADGDGVLSPGAASSGGSSVSAPSSPLLKDVPTVTATLRKERGSSSRSRHQHRERERGVRAERGGGRAEEGERKEPRLTVPGELRPLLASPSPSPSPDASPLPSATSPHHRHPASSPSSPAQSPAPCPVPALTSPTKRGSLTSNPSPSTRVVAPPLSRPVRPRQAITAIASDYPLSLLLAEDNPVNQKMMRMFLKKLGYDAELAVNGEEVLERMKARVDRGEAPHDVILMDVNMDGMDGIECTRRLRQQAEGGGARVFIIAQTANAHPESKAKCLDVGMNSFLPKPVILEELARQLKLAKALPRAVR